MAYNVKLTQETLRQQYLHDLSLPDIHHGRTTPKVRNIEQWKGYQSWYANEPRQHDVFGPSKIYIWSDIHFGHNNIIKYANRPYPNVELMHSCLIGNYLNTVTHNDIVIFGGDIGFMSERKINDILESLPGYKIQIIGNHDIHRNGKLYELAVQERHPCLLLDVADIDCSYQLLFTHYPMDNIPDGCINIHGHIHQNPAPTKKHFNMCVEHTNFTPQPLTRAMAHAREVTLAGL